MAPDFLKKDRFIAGLWAPLKEKVRGRFPVTYEVAVEVARLKNKKLCFQARGAEKEEVGGSQAPLATSIPMPIQRSTPQEEEEDQHALLNRITSQLENLSVHLVQQGRAPARNPEQGRTQ